MIDRFSALDEGDYSAPATALDLSARMRELRARQGLKQSEVARRMGLDPSIPSLWEQGKRPVPANRVQALADALGVNVDELLGGASMPETAATADPPAFHEADADLDDAYAGAMPLLRLVPSAAPEASTPVEEPPPIEAVFQIAERPPLVGWTPPGWEPTDRIQDISPSLPDGYWLDPVKLERTSARQLLYSRLCVEDQATVGDQQVPGAVLAERIFQHCARQPAFVSDRLPLIESIFRAVLAAEHGGLTDAALVETLSVRASRGDTPATAAPGAVPLTPQLLRRLRDSVRPYPMRSVDRQVFVPRRDPR
ncbi:MAG: helix-turn-helix transcriptional regulator [Chloroflexi bacterium]|nr:helix-turn-helix transcriptional regulator [Chloroflexota bacterium]